MFMQPENQKRYFEATARKCSTGEKVKKLRKIYEKYAEKVQESLKQLIQKRTEKNLQIFFNHYQTFTA